MYINTISKTSFCYLGLAYATSQDLTMTHAYIGLKFRYASTNNAEGSCHQGVLLLDAILLFKIPYIVTESLLSFFQSNFA